VKIINALNEISNKLINLSKYNLSLIPKCSNERTKKTVKVKFGKFSQIKKKKTGIIIYDIKKIRLFLSLEIIFFLLAVRISILPCAIPGHSNGIKKI
jgi:hypothetical protein